MIVSRRFVPFLQLYRKDPLAAKVLEKGFKIDKKNDCDYYRNVWQHNLDTRIVTADMDCCIPDFGFIVREFEKLDITNPYDSGLSMDDVCDCEYLSTHDGKVHIALIGPYCSLVGIATINVSDCSPHKNYPVGDFSCLNKYKVVD